MVNHQLFGLLCHGDVRILKTQRQPSGPGLPLASVFTVSGVSPNPVGSEGWWEAVRVWTPTLPPCGPDSSSHGVLQRRFPSQSAFLLPLCLFCFYSPSKFCPNEWTSKETRGVTKRLQKEKAQNRTPVKQWPVGKGFVQVSSPSLAHDTILSPGQPSLSLSKGRF